MGRFCKIFFRACGACSRKFVSRYPRGKYCTDTCRQAGLIQKSSRRRATKRGASVSTDSAAMTAFVAWVRTAKSIRCYWCRKITLPDDRHVDHIIPLFRKGAHAPFNLCCACSQCNLSKGTLLPEEFSTQANFNFWSVPEDTDSIRETARKKRRQNPSGRSAARGKGEFVPFVIKSTHGLSATPEFAAWNSIRNQCLSPSHSLYSFYGARGITICARWADSVEAFIEDVGLRPSPEYELRRNDPLGNFEPGKCGWVLRTTPRDRRTNVIIMYRAKLQNLNQWACELGIKSYLIGQRIANGMPIPLALYAGRINRMNRARIETALRDAGAFEGEFWWKKRSTGNLPDPNEATL